MFSFHQLLFIYYLCFLVIFCLYLHILVLFQFYYLIIGFFLVMRNLLHFLLYFLVILKFIICLLPIQFEWTKLLMPGLDNTRLFMSLTAGAGTRCMSLLSSPPSLHFLSLSSISLYYIYYLYFLHIFNYKLIKSFSFWLEFIRVFIHYIILPAHSHHRIIF